MSAIFKREFRAYFRTVTGWLYIAAGMALYGLYFYAINMSYGEPLMSSALGSALFLGMITVPILTMRTLAEEKRSRTDQLLFTSPVSVGRVVVAKYLACAAVHSLSMAAICVAPWIMRTFGDAPLAENYVAVLGFWLYGLCCIAIGIFASSLTESQLISAVLTFAFLFVGYMMNGITQLISSSGNFLTKILSAYDLLAPMDSFFSGSLSLTGILYYLSLAALFLFFATQALQKRRWDASVKTLKTGVFSSGLIVVGAVVAVVVNLFATALPASATAIDVTAGKIYSLTEQTTDFLAALDKDVTIYVISSEENEDTTVASTLRNYAEASKHITVDYRDPIVSPTFYQEYTDTQVTQGSLIVVCGDVSRIIDSADLYVTEFDYTTYTQSVTGYDAEGQITSALRYVTSGNIPKVYELTGHGETALSGGFSEAITKANFETAELSLLTADAVPDDARALIVNGPTSDLSKDDADKLVTWLETTGGNLIVTYDYTAPDDMPNLASVLAAAGLTAVPGMVIEGDANYYYQQPTYLLPEVVSNAYTTSLGQSYVFAPYARGITRAAEPPEGVTYYPMLTSTASSFSKKNIQQATTFDYEEGDEAGPFDIAVAAEITITDEALSQLVVLGSDLILTDDADSMVSGANAALFADVLSNFVDLSGDGTVVVPSKPYTVTALTVPTASGLVVGSLYIAIVPIALMVFGIMIWARRRRA